ncbi:penicillin-binding transpeptidase domain-containing protein [Nocardioides marinquilinus]|uniref:Penicillin-binding transpeptidase domain-containing protein n=1 Tax=Nocardioides marinquilinus TaxID=1210400 RepID=A0ABP9P7H6_9ACTN
MRIARSAALRPALAAPLALLLAATLVACSEDEPDPADAGEKADGTAAALVEGLASGDLRDVPFTELTGAEATKDFEGVVAEMDDIEPTVELGTVAEDGDSASATLTWTWPLIEGEDWTYKAPVALERGSVDDSEEWAIVWDHSVVEPSLNANSVLEADPVSAERGDIVGANDAKLVTNRPVVRVGIDRTQVGKGQAGASAEQLAQLAGIDVGSFVSAVEGAGDQAFVEGIVLREDDVPPALLSGYESIKGARLIADEIPLGPTRDFAAPILGTVGEVSAEMIKADPTLEVGDRVGLSGLEARYEDQLRGAEGVVVSAVGTDGAAREIHRTKGGKGKNLVITLDEGLQTEAESLLANTTPASALVAIRPSDGAILAAANGPGNGDQNLATFGQYAPGSTFKSVSSLALLRRGLKPDDVVDCSSTVIVDGAQFENYDDYPSSGLGNVPFRTALANSCNTAFIRERTRLKGSDLADAAASLGLGVDHDLGFPAYFGQVPPPETETGAAADMIGQGTVLASPMAMATVIASIQNGSLVVPRLVEQVDVAPPDGVEPVTEGEAEQLRSLLRSVVTDGSGGFLLSLPGPEVIAKTGTAEFQDGDQLKTHAWMVGAQGDLAVAVFVEEGSSGSGTAGPILEAFLRAAG